MTLVSVLAGFPVLAVAPVPALSPALAWSSPGFAHAMAEAASPRRNEKKGARTCTIRWDMTPLLLRRSRAGALEGPDQELRCGPARGDIAAARGGSRPPPAE